MSYKPTKPTSAFTERAFEKNVKGVAEYTGLSTSYIYGILSGTFPDHLDYARDIHRALVIVDPEHADEFRNMLDADAGKARKGRTSDGSPDDLTLHKYLDDMKNILIRRDKNQADDVDVQSVALKLRTLLDSVIRLKVPSPAEMERAMKGTGD
jgi:hypothetical protein